MKQKSLMQWSSLHLLTRNLVDQCALLSHNDKFEVEGGNLCSLEANGKVLLKGVKLKEANWGNYC